MKGATGNYYFGLLEFEDMCFLIHLLRDVDLFVDVGANIGSYTILASGHVGAKTISIEPLPSTFRRLENNVRYNDLDHRVTLCNQGVGEDEGKLWFTTSLDAMNHVATESDYGDKLEVPVTRLDDLLGDQQPLCIKIDVEGFEARVLDGSTQTLGASALRAVILELNGSGNRYGLGDQDVHRRMLDLGFTPHTYDPFERNLNVLEEHNSIGNTLYLRDLDWVRERLETANDIALPWRAIEAPERLRLDRDPHSQTVQRSRRRHRETVSGVT